MSLIQAGDPAVIIRNGANGGAPAAVDNPVLHKGVYADLRHRLITGRITAGSGLSTRGLALELGVSQMPVRDALSRLAADGAVAIRSKRRIEIPAMTSERFVDLLECRLLLEPAAAALAMRHIDADQVERLRKFDDELDQAIEAKDIIGYMEGNFSFHFGLYSANSRPTLNHLIENLWLQFGPFMPVVYERYTQSDMIRPLDQHKIAIAAILAGDEAALRHAIAEDIRDGMGLVGRHLRRAA